MHNLIIVLYSITKPSIKYWCNFKVISKVGKLSNCVSMNYNHLSIKVGYKYFLFLVIKISLST